MKNPLTPAGIEPVTYRYVAQHLNHCATAVPIIRKLSFKNCHRVIGIVLKIADDFNFILCLAFKFFKFPSKPIYILSLWSIFNNEAVV